MPPSVHDNKLVSYEVQCEARTITIRTERRERDAPTQFANIILTGVQAYHLQNDAFGNIIFDLEGVPVDQFLRDYGAEISESFRRTGAPGPWAANPSDAAKYLREQDAQAFILSSSYGLDGWILAREIIVPVQT
jgi:hypothetical protein